MGSGVWRGSGDLGSSSDIGSGDIGLSIEMGSGGSGFSSVMNRSTSRGWTGPSLGMNRSRW